MTHFTVRFPNSGREYTFDTKAAAEAYAANAPIAVLIIKREEA